MFNGPETCRHAHASLSQVQRGAQQRLIAQLEHFRTTTAALAAHHSLNHSTHRHARGIPVGTQVGHPTPPPMATAAAVVRQPGLTVSVFLVERWPRSARGRTCLRTCTSAVHDTNSPESGQNTCNTRAEMSQTALDRTGVRDTNIA
eukprot:2477019-Prymnesium_polylepis.1